MTANFPAPVLHAVATDRRLSHVEARAVFVLWATLSAVEYRPLKMASLGALLQMRREHAARVMRRLIACGYVDCIEPPDRSQPREFLMVNVVREAA